MTKTRLQPDLMEVADAILSSSEGLTAESLTERLMSYSEATKAYLMTKGLLMQLIGLEFDVQDQEVWQAVAFVNNLGYDIEDEMGSEF